MIKYFPSSHLLIIIVIVIIMIKIIIVIIIHEFIFRDLEEVRSNKFLVKHFVIKTSDKKYEQRFDRSTVIFKFSPIVSEIVYMRNSFIHELELENDRGAVETLFVFFIACFYNKMLEEVAHNSQGLINL